MRLIDQRDLGYRLPIDPALQEVFDRAQKVRVENRFVDSTRLLLMTELAAHPTIEPILSRMSHGSSEFIALRDQMRDPRGYQYPGSPYVTIQAANIDVMQMAARECSIREGSSIGTRDVMIGMMQLQPPPVDRALRYLRVDTEEAIARLRGAGRFRIQGIEGMVSLPQKPFSLEGLWARLRN